MEYYLYRVKVLRDAVPSGRGIQDVVLQKMRAAKDRFLCTELAEGAGEGDNRAWAFPLPSAAARRQSFAYYFRSWVVLSGYVTTRIAVRSERCRFVTRELLLGTSIRTS